MDLKQAVGQKSQIYTLPPDPARVEAFARAIGTMVEDEVCPTWITVCREGEFELLKKLGVPLAQVLHGEQEYQYLRPIKKADPMTYRTVLSQVMEKRGSHAMMTFMIFESEIFCGSDQDRPAALSRSTLIYRELAK